MGPRPPPSSSQHRGGALSVAPQLTSGISEQLLTLSQPQVNSFPNAVAAVVGEVVGSY